MNVIFIFLVFDVTNSSFSVSMLMLSYLIPQIIFSFIGGIVADLRSKKSILLLGNISRALLVLLLFINPDSPVLVYLVALFLSVITQFYIPAEAPLIPQLVEKKDLFKANSLFGTVLFGSTLVGYVVAGPAVQFLEYGGAFILVAVLYIVAAILAAVIPWSPNGIHIDESSKLIRKNLREEIHGLYQLLRYSRAVGGSFFLLAFSQTIILVLANIVPGYAESILHVSVENLSLLVFAPAALGMILSSILLGGFFNEKSEDILMNIGVFLSAAVLILFPFIPTISELSQIHTFLSLHASSITAAAIFVPVLAFVAGFANAFIYIPSQTIIQGVVPTHSRSKIFGLLYALIGAFSLIPVVITGGVADIFGVETVLITLGCIIILIGAVRVKRKL